MYREKIIVAAPDTPPSPMPQCLSASGERRAGRDRRQLGRAETKAYIKWNARMREKLKISRLQVVQSIPLQIPQRR